MNQELKDKINNAHSLMKSIESLNEKIKLYEDFKNDKELKCKITRPETKCKNNYSYVDTINIDNEGIILHALIELQMQADFDRKIKESELDKIIKSI